MKSPNTFYTYAQNTAQEITEELKDLSSTWSSHIDTNLRELKTPHDLFIENMWGGKLLRGTLVKLGYDLTKTTPSKAIIKPAVAYEMLHSSFLIHDDIIDKSTLRRSKPTLHTTLGANHYALSQSICLGDLGFFLAMKLLSESDFPENLKNKAVTLFAQIAVDTTLGEMLDVELAHSGTPNQEQQVLTIHLLKTALYTIVGPLSIGAMLAGASKAHLEKIKTFGVNLGIAFQIQDDILGCFGDEKRLGKSICSDIEEGKNTLLIAHAMQKATPLQKTILEKYYGKGKITQKARREVLQIIQDTSSLTYSQNKAQAYINKAKKLIPNITKNKPTQQLLTEFADLLINREK